MKMFDFLKSDKIHGALNGLNMKVSQAKPEIMLISGGISVLIGTIVACKKTSECEKVISSTKEDIKKIDNQYALPPADSEIVLTKEETRQIKINKGRSYIRAYGYMMYNFVRIYGVSALLWFGGMCSIFGAHNKLRKINKSFAAQLVASAQMMTGYRKRVASAVGNEIEQKIFMGAQENMVNVVETDPETKEKKIVQRKSDEFYAQPGSIFARNYTAATTDLLYRMSTEQFDEYLQSRINNINLDLETGYLRALTGVEILRRLGIDENTLGYGEEFEMLMNNGISANARLVPDPEMRKLKVTKLRGYEKKWDVARNMEIWEPCLRLDFNFYPLAGKV